MSRLGSGRRWFLLAVVLLLPVFTAPWWMRAMGRWLVVRETPAPADYLLVLGGDSEVRPVVAAWAYHQGLARKILYSQPSDRFEREVPFDPPERELIPAILQKAGVPARDIIALPGEVDGTLGEGERLADYLRTHGGESVLVVTTNWHTRRAGWILQKKVGDSARIQMLPAPSPGFDPETWWRSPGGLEMVLAEYLKIIWSSLRG
jgi:uncharacterized SAM-binding protein YcdF (DUF218 family)